MKTNTELESMWGWWWHCDKKKNRNYENSIVVYNLTKQTFNYAMSSPMNT
jgi:hypothetical protein